MIFWIIAGAMTFAAVLLMIWPLYRRRGPTADRAAYGLRLYRKQLAELEDDCAEGRISADQRAAARLEIERRILEAAEEAGHDRPPATPPRRNRFLAASGIAVLVPATAFVLYSALGQPGLPGSPFSESRQRPTSADASLASLTAKIEQRLEAAPDDAEAWIMLGRAALAGRDTAKAVRALQRALTLRPNDPAALAAYGEALTAAAGGQVTAAAERAFRQALAQAPENAGARFYLGLLAYQQNDRRTALQHWIALETDLPSDAREPLDLSRRIDNAAREAGLDAAALRQAERDRRANAAMADPQVLAMVDRLAARLATEPGDTDGWLRLGRSYQVLERPADAVQAFRRAAASAPDRTDAQLAYVEALFVPGTAGTDLPEAFRTGVRRLLEIAPDLPQALYFGGVIAAADGDAATARRFWGPLIEQLDADAPVRSLLQRRLDSLSGKPAQPEQRDQPGN